MLWLFPFAFLPLPRLTPIASRQLPSQGNIRFLSYLPFPPSPSTAGEELFRDSATGVRYLSIESTVTGGRRTTTAADYQIKGHAVEDNSSAGWGCSPPKRRRFLSSQIAMAGLGSSSSEIDLDHPNIEEYLTTETIREAPKKLHLRDLLDISPTLTEAAGAIVDDSFTRCFKSNPPEPWNWNVYLFPLWCLGVVVRYGILFPLRVAIVAAGWIAFFSAFFPVHFLLRGHKKWRLKIERKLVGMMCSVFVASWTGVIKYHGPRPSIRPQQVFVANHTSMIDFVILEQMTAFAVIMQKHPGWVGFIQKTILESVGCIWFNRTEAKDREIVARKIREHTQGVDNNPLLIFPEGTCVNNHYTVMFKKGAFELGCAVCPVAIKYNKIFVDAFWNSKKQSFTMHLVRLMTSWAVVCDVWYLEPQYIRPGETPIEFAERVRDMISVRAGLKKVPWDGYLKYFRPSPKLRECKQQIFAESVLQRLEEK